MTDTVTTETESPLAAAGTGTVVSWHAERRPDQLAIVSDYGDRTYAELDAAANRLARALYAAGLRPGDALALVCRNRPEFPEVYAAVQRSGLRLTPVNWHLTGAEMAYIVSDCEAKAIVADAAFADWVAEAVEGNDTLLVKLAVGEPIRGFSSYDESVAGGDASPPPPPGVGRPMLFTSGPTRRPQGVAPPTPPPRASA